MKTTLSILIALSAFAAVGCAVGRQPRMATVDHVTLPEFMGPWYVIASIPTRWERNAYNAVESYALHEDGTIQTTFTFNQNSADGPVRTMEPKGYVRDASNAVWGMQFIWPFKSEYLIAYLNKDYTQTIIARTKRDYVWIMARTPQISAADYQSLVGRVAALGYDVAKLRRVPQRQGN